MSSPLSICGSVIFFFLCPLYKHLQQLIWTITGVQASRELAASGACYERSVHVQKVIWGIKSSRNLATVDTDEFLTVHDRFDHPTILTDPSISLYGLSTTEAVFLKTNSEVDIFSSDTYPFIKWAQTENAEMVYTIPLASFHQLAEEVGDPKLPVIWISSIGRCGSTLLGQVFERVPGTVLLSEPDAVTSLTFMNKGGKISKEEARRLLRSVIRLQCKTPPGAQRIVLKVAAFTFAEVKDIYEMFPNIQHIFLFRDFLPYTMSSKIIIEKLLKGGVIKQLLTWVSVKKTDLYTNCIRIDRNDHFLEDQVVTLTFLGLWVMLAASIIKRYEEFRDNGIPIFAILYEDLITEKEDMVRKIFQKLAISEKHVSAALAAFEADSHRGYTSRRKSRNVTAEELSETNFVLGRYGFANCDVRVNLPGQIKPSVKEVN